MKFLGRERLFPLENYSGQEHRLSPLILSGLTTLPIQFSRRVWRSPIRSARAGRGARIFSPEDPPPRSLLRPLSSSSRFSWKRAETLLGSLNARENLLVNFQFSAYELGTFYGNAGPRRRWCRLLAPRVGARSVNPERDRGEPERQVPQQQAILSLSLAHFASHPALLPSRTSPVDYPLRC